MKKIVVLIITILLILITIISYKIYCNKVIMQETNKKNKIYENFYNTQVLGTNVASLINKTIDLNNKNEIEKDSNGKYIENNKNSIKIEIKFLELDKIISLENIEKQGIDKFVKNFGAYSFKCTKLDYHKNTKNIKYLYFEQV